jgi:signal peptidase I
MAVGAGFRGDLGGTAIRRGRAARLNCAIGGEQLELRHHRAGFIVARLPFGPAAMGAPPKDARPVLAVVHHLGKTMDRRRINERPLSVYDSQQKPQEKKKEGGLLETARVIFHALIIALVIRTFLFQPFNIPSGSMEATLLIGDYLFVSKYSYGYSRYSFPLSLPLFNGRIFGSDPDRGDVVVFRLPKDDSTDYIKRVIGLPGDRIQMIGGILHINSEAVKRERIADFIHEDGRRVRRWKETLPNGVSYNALDLQDNGFLDNTQVYEVPAGHFFMMGDNRDNSTDSRVLSQVGYVPFDNIIGRAQIIFFSVGDGVPAWHVWTWPWAVRWGRLLTLVR